MTRIEVAALADHYEELGDSIASAWLREEEGRFPPKVVTLAGSGHGGGNGDGYGSGYGNGNGSGYGNGNGYGSGYGNGNGSGYGNGNGYGDGNGNGNGYGDGNGNGNGNGSGYGSGHGHGKSIAFIPNHEVFMPTQGQYVVVRSHDQGCVCGEYVSHHGREVTLRLARQIWSWTGERLALIDFSVVPGDCRLSRQSAGEVVLLEACGIIPTTPEVEKFLRTKAHD